jgi:hypothetical protein
MIETKALGSTAAARISVLLLLLSSGCDMELFSSDRDGELPESDNGLRMSVLSDPSGIAHYDWLNWRSTPDTVVAQASTPFLADTFAVARPQLNETLTFGFQIRAVDEAGNAGSFSPAHMWSLANEDTTPPPPPDTVVVDTLIAAIAVWPETIEVERGTEVQLYAALLLIETAGEAVDSLIVCDTPPPAQGALYESGTFCCGCDSAMAVLQRSYEGNSPALIALYTAKPERTVRDRREATPWK